MSAPSVTPASRSDVAYAGYDLSKYPDTKDARYIGKCLGCKKPKSALVPMTLMKLTYYFGQPGGETWTQVSFTYKADRAARNALATLTCDHCGSDALRMKPVDGKYNADHKCDARCMNAKGPNCECACGGANHGAAYG